MRDTKGKVLQNLPISPRTYMMQVLAPQITPYIKAGHFVMIKVSHTKDPIGRRAFAVADIKKESLFIFYDVVGRGTELLSGFSQGSEVDILGPLGKGLFNLEGDKHLLIGGGIGLAGLTLLGKELRKAGKTVFFLYGARSKEQVSMESWLKEEGFDYLIYTQDGSYGKKGLITDALSDFDSSWVVSACGPKGMLKALKNLVDPSRLYLSLESRMACGWGVCLGCVVKNKEGKYVRVCYEGPVFRGDEVSL